MSVVLVISAVFLVCIWSAAQVAANITGQTHTEDHLRQAGFWTRNLPRRGGLAIGVVAICLVCIALRTAKARQNGQAGPALASTSEQNVNTRPGLEYVGDEACRTCHSSIYESFKQTGMGRSTSTPSSEDLRELAKPVTVVSKKPNRSYRVYGRDGKIIHEETGTDDTGRVVFSESHDIAFTVGAGDMGKSYLISKGDSLFVSPVSYYTRIQGWDLSPGYNEGLFRGFTRRVGDLCVDCHTGLPQLTPGSHDRFQQPPFRFLTVGCERCHGPGAVHVAQRTIDPYVGGPVDPSIVNPRKLQPDLRDNICMQCHLAGDARVLQPGKNYLDFRPGTPLGDVVAIFSVPQAIKGNHFVLLDQFEELKLSRCWRASNGRLGCISCHDPHVQLHGTAAVDFFRTRCLTCHTTASCSAPRATRQATAPADNCILCHMPQQPSEKIDHTSLTDHRILRSQSETPALMEGGLSAPLDLINDTKPSDSAGTQNLRNLALAYAQVGARYPEFDEKALRILESAAAAFPADAEVQAIYGKALILARTGKREIAAQSLQRAIDTGSKSAEVRTMLARLRLQEGQVTAAIDLYKESIRLDPYFMPAYLDLARAYSILKDRQSALEMLDTVLKQDPGNDAAREERLKVAAMPR
jgi:thioredoxin-like negative regulator of GroEL